MTTAEKICQQACEVMAQRGKHYDKDGVAERSMLAIVTAFNAVTGHKLTEEQGWHFMTLLKMVRSQQGQYRADNYLDGTAYFALAGECASKQASQYNIDDIDDDDAADSKVDYRSTRLGR